MFGLLNVDYTIADVWGDILTTVSLAAAPHSMRAPLVFLLRETKTNLSSWEPRTYSMYHLSSSSSSSSTAHGFYWPHARFTAKVCARTVAAARRRHTLHDVWEKTRAALSGKHNKKMSSRTIFKRRRALIGLCAVSSRGPLEQAEVICAVNGSSRGKSQRCCCCCCFWAGLFLVLWRVFITLKGNG